MLIAVTGYKNSGKNAVCNVLESEFGFKITGMADALKEQMLILDPYIPVTFTGFSRLSDLIKFYGWDVCKERFPEVRRLLQIGGTEAGRRIFGENIWAEVWYKRTKVWLEQGYDICVSDMRFLNEAAFVRELDGEVWRIYRPGTGGDLHSSETELDKIKVDWTIQNNGGLDHLPLLVRSLMTGAGR